MLLFTLMFIAPIRLRLVVSIAHFVKLKITQIDVETEDFIGETFP